MLVVTACRCWPSSRTTATWRGDTVFWLKYFLSSQSAILWMSMLFFMSTAFYWIGMFARGPAAALEGLGSKLPGGRHAGAGGHHGALVRGLPDRPDIGHIPVSNLYEVFVLFSWITACSTCTTRRSTRPAPWVPS
jgi:ABC-type transport system involved in cytochrome c biogenesis permease subunit